MSRPVFHASEKGTNHFLMIISVQPVILKFSKLQKKWGSLFFSFTLKVVKIAYFSAVREKAKLINRNGYKFDSLKENLN